MTLVTVWLCEYQRVKWRCCNSYLDPPKGSEKEVAHLLVKSGTDSVDVYLCPKAFFDGMGTRKGIPWGTDCCL
jgi:hypothetical protein